VRGIINSLKKLGRCKKLIYTKINGIQINFSSKEKLKQYICIDMKNNLKSLEIEINGHLKSTLYSLCWLFELSELEDIKYNYNIKE
jgi:hypothetical protein